MDRFDEIAQRYPNIIPQTKNNLKEDLMKLSSFGIPTYLDTWANGDLRINFCTQQYIITCSLTSFEDGYRIGHINPLSIKHHNLIARKSVSLLTPQWLFHNENADLKRFYRDTGLTPQSGIKYIKGAWAEVERVSNKKDEKSTKPSLEHERFLSSVEYLIELARQTEIAEAASRSSTPILSVEPVVQHLYVGHQYKFNLAGPTDLIVGDYVLASYNEPIQQQAECVGVVRELHSDSILIHFNQPVDLGRLKRVEWLIPFSSQKQYDIQTQAVQALREKKSENKYLLQCIVDGLFQPFQTNRDTQISGERLNQAQKKVIALAETVPDILLVLGPPGTGKTHTIRQIVNQHAKLGKRILVTSKNNKAVDNVLEALTEVNAIRIGRVEKVSDAVQPFLIDEKAQLLQKAILKNTNPLLTKLTNMKALWPQIEETLTNLLLSVNKLQESVNKKNKLKNDLKIWQREKYNDIEPVLTKQQKKVGQIILNLAQDSDESRQISNKLNRVKPYCQMPLFGPLFVLWADRKYSEWQQIMKAYRRKLREIEVLNSYQQQIWQSYKQIVTASDEAISRKELIVKEAANLENQKQKSLIQLNNLNNILTQIDFYDLPVLPKSVDSIDSIYALEALFRDWHKQISAKHQLLVEWQDRLENRHRALYPTLIKMADIIGATCIGIATDANFSDLDFDLVIADEAGQIQVMDLLVPLVRAKTAILVGDHRQLPPVVDSAVAEQLDPTEDELNTWLELSLFEKLFNNKTPDSHKVMLDTQYRMPKTIADFISDQFYNGEYHTGRNVPYTDPFFNTPIVLIDTKLEKNRRERQFMEAENARGYINHLEANLIADVVLSYEDHGDEWGVIVPYKKQAEKIRKVLKQRRPIFSSTHLEDWVATVDSFQGKERNVIIFGFTRSNSSGRIGFLRELRRLNVSLTRAKQQLVLIGDSLTLTRANDKPFADLMCALLESAQSSPGGYFHARELKQQFSKSQ